MKCTHCGKEINEMVEKYKVITLDGDFIHENCIEEFNQYGLLEDKFILDIVEEHDKNDDGTRYTLEDVIELAKSLIGNEDIRKHLK